MDLYPEAVEQLAALPVAALADYAQVQTVLGLVPWNGDPLNAKNPDGAVRTMPFGAAGMVIYLILEDQRRVDVIELFWLG